MTPASREGFVAVPGGKVWFKEFPGRAAHPAGGGKPAAPLVVLHGGPGATHDYLGVLSALAPARPVIFYEQLGSHRSPAPGADKSLWTVERFVAELDALADGLGLGAFDVLGHSWGGALAVEYALAHPQRVGRLVLASPLLSTPLWLLRAQRLLEELPQDARRTIAAHERAGTTASQDYQDAAMAFYRRFACRLPRWPAELEFSFARLNAEVYQTMWGPSEFTATGRLAGFDRMDALAALESPVLVTGGRYDEAGPEILSRAARTLRDGRLEIFEHSAHVPHLEETERYLEVVGEFLRRFQILS